MSHAVSQPDTIFSLSPNIQVLPIVHGSGDMAQTVRDIMVSQEIDCLALPLPPSVESLVEEGITALKWAGKEELNFMYNNTYPNISLLIDMYKASFQ